MCFIGLPGTSLFTAGMVAVWPGVRFGSRILDPQQTRNAKEAIRQGYAVVLSSHALVFALITVLGTLAALSQGTLSMLLLGPIYGVIAFGFSMLFPGCLTIPAGMLGAWLLFKARDIGTVPSGCRLHGYREITAGQNEIL
jgi:hypothetical protein